MIQTQADYLLLREDEPAALMVGDAARPLTKAPLPGPQVIALLREIATPAASKQIDAKAPATFGYENTDGVFAVKLMRNAEKWHVTLQVDERADFARRTGAHQAMDLPPEVATQAPPATAASNGAAHDMDRLLRKLVELSGSDLHLRVGEPPIVRKHGEMMRVEAEAVLDSSRIEAMLASIMPERNKKEFAEVSDSDFAHEIKGVARFRANALRDRNGAAAVFRVIPAQVVTVEQMGVTQEVQNLCFLTKGLVLVTGPTGSGKSTTLCALMDLVNRARSDHVITIEDPIEFVHPNKGCIFTQRQVGVHTGSFKAALRAALREDPDIILVGELRDLETTAIAIETAETGHLVFGTLHTTTAPSTIDRLIDQFPADRQEQVRTMLSESLKGVISQVLCKKVGGGRVAAREILLVNSAISNLIREGKTFQIQSIMQTSKRLGMQTMNDELMSLVERKIVEPKEAYMKSVDKTSFVNSLKAKGFETSYVESDATAQKPAPGAPAKR
ncbi:MAG TPA: PilT/PilU family type 4a pilus ATPase [Gemmatimonadaceae bacterium]|nr:PilT/PilU family type 4a pilus ATPase [Gemmatimonadaceae bacterium]